MARDYAAFISYASRYSEWVWCLHRNLELALASQGETRKVFPDQTDLSLGQSWVAQLQAGVSQADQLVLIVTPEALTSPRVADEWEAFVAENPDWLGRLQVVVLVDTPLPPILSRIQPVSFEEHDRKKYEEALSKLLGALLGARDRRLRFSLPDEIEIPDPPAGLVPREARRKLVKWLAPQLKQKQDRVAVASFLGFEWALLEGHPSLECAASAALVKATGDDDPVAGARRIVKALRELFEEDPKSLEFLEALAGELAEVDSGGSGGLLGLWLDRVRRDNSELLPYFDQHTELPLLDQVYVQLQVRSEQRRASMGEAAEASMRLDSSLTLSDVLELSARNHPGITHRWVVLGDPGAGKTTLLRHLAATSAGQQGSKWVPVFDSLPRLMREPEWLLDRLERQLSRAGHQARGLGAVLEGLGREGRLLLLLDGLDEVACEDRSDAESLLRDLSSRWPASALVVTSRPIGYRRPASEFRELELLPFDRERQREFLARWLGRSRGEQATERAEAAAAVLERDASLRDLSGNPLYLTLMAALIEKGTSPDRHRAGLYDQVFQLLLDGAHRPAGGPMEAQDAVRRTLRFVAREMTRDNRDAEPVTALEARLYQPECDALRQHLERVPRWRRSLRPFLDEVAERTGILGPHDGPHADWRYWHRTFREALAAEALEEKLGEEGGEAALLENVRTIAQEDLSRWAEPYALLAGRVKDPDALVQRLVQENRDLGLRALASSQGLRDETLFEVLELSEKWQERAKVYERLPELIDDPTHVLALIDQLRQRRRSGNDLYFLERAVAAATAKWPDARRAAEQVLRRFYDHVPEPPEDLFRWIETPRDGRVELWQEIPPGECWIGSPKGVGHNDERPRHRVEIVRPFWLAAVPVTRAQYAAFDPRMRYEQRYEHPVVGVTWYEAVSFCRWLSSLAGFEGVRLPTEWEWEYACRAGSETAYWKGESEKHLALVGWYDKNSDRRTHAVGEKPANPWGLYDVHGNVWEWTASVGNEYAGREDVIEVDPSEEPADLAAPPGVRRVMRGGCYSNVAAGARSAYRLHGNPEWEIGSHGFRLLASSPPIDSPLEKPR